MTHDNSSNQPRPTHAGQAKKYRPFVGPPLAQRQWPSRSLVQPPIWCSVDLRDGNQALVEPMEPARKLKLFECLVAMGFKEIEVGFPSASQTDLEFIRLLIEENRIPPDVTIQVLTQARDELITKTFAALKGARQAIVHLYNSTSELQRRVVFGLERRGIIDIAERATRLIKTLGAEHPKTRLQLEYSPESFSGTEPEFAVEICAAVMQIWQPTARAPIILNLPATVEMSTPNAYADQVEWFCDHLPRRDTAIISVHPHNDRGTAVAAAELAQMAGAQRVEGTLFGNGERTGNVDIITLALNLLTQGVDPQLDIRDIDAIVQVAQYCTRLPVHPRHPYAGQLVYTAFSGSHQDAINKGLRALKNSRSQVWEVPYLPIDPSDVGRTYEAIIRINSQSGKGGVAHILERDFGVEMPRWLQIDFSRRVQEVTDRTGKEMMPHELGDLFTSQYLQPKASVRFLSYSQLESGEQGCNIGVELDTAQGRQLVHGHGNGPLDAFMAALRQHLGIQAEIVEYAEHAIAKGSAAQAMAYVQVRCANGNLACGAGRHQDIVVASLQALLVALHHGQALPTATR